MSGNIVVASAIPGLNREKCVQRSRIDVARFHASGFPVQLRGSTPAQYNDGFTVSKQSGWLPGDDAASLKAINQRLATPLAQDDVYLLMLEAANSRFIPSYSEYLGESTLRNFSEDAAAGVSFMNSHRTGRLSAPAELPFGQTYCGGYQVGVGPGGLPMQRTLMGVYMLRGVYPNGANGPSTDDLYASAQAGVVKDVSVGFFGGEEWCDVCGNIMDPYDDRAWSEPDANGYSRLLCRHIPGTTRNMTGEQIASQQARDPLNKKGVASYTVQDGGLSEVSAVYDGAVPGAGIRQLMALLQDANTDDAERAAMLAETHDLWGDLLPLDLVQAMSHQFNREVNNMRVPLPTLARNRAALQGPPNPIPAPAPRVQVDPLQAENEQLRQQLAVANERLGLTEEAQLAAVSAAQEAQLAAFTDRIRANVAPAAMPRVLDLYEAAQAMDNLQLSGPDGEALSISRHAYDARGERSDTVETVSLAQLVEDAFMSLGTHGALQRITVGTLNPNGVRAGANGTAADNGTAPAHAVSPVVHTPGTAAQHTPVPAAAVRSEDEVDPDFVARATNSSSLGKTGIALQRNRDAHGGAAVTQSGPYTPGTA